MCRIINAVLLLTVVLHTAIADESQVEEQRAFEDKLLDELQGQWSMKGTILGEPVEYRLNGKWVLLHQFLLLEIWDTGKPLSYEAAVYIGFDSSRDRYVVHWLDGFGGKPSAILGYGRSTEDAIQLFFDYSSGQFRDTFTFERGSGKWRFYFEAQTTDGTWSEFADYWVERNPEEKPQTIR